MAFVGKVAIGIAYLEPLAHKTVFPSPCRIVELIHMAARAGSKRAWRCSPFPQKYPISGCSSLFSHPRPHLGPSERQMGLALSLPPMAGAEPAY